MVVVLPKMKELVAEKVGEKVLEDNPIEILTYCFAPKSPDMSISLLATFTSPHSKGQPIASFRVQGRRWMHVQTRCLASVDRWERFIQLFQSFQSDLLSVFVTTVTRNSEQNPANSNEE